MRPSRRPPFRPPDSWRPIPPLLPKPKTFPYFEVHLLVPGGDRRRFTPKAVDDLAASCPFPPADFFSYPAGGLAGKLLFRRWEEALEAALFLWGRRLDGAHLFAPAIISPVLADSHKAGEARRLKALFSGHVSRVLEGEIMRKWEKRTEELVAEIEAVAKRFQRPMRINEREQMAERRRQIEVELEVVNGRLAEFREAMGCLIDHLRERPKSEGKVEVFGLGEGFDWVRIHSVVVRECRRLSEGLPIYAYRRKIVQEISTNQVIVLIGETGCGKSTQLVQFLADSGLAGDKSIVCTQPRKIAASSLAARVGEESVGCYADNFIISYPTFSSYQGFGKKVIFMTDHCLLQHYMRDMNLNGISHIIVDEAHERSLNTDLLLALIKKELLKREDLRLIIMSATADASKLAEYFFGCSTVYVMGRSFPVDIKYVPDVSSEAAWSKIPKVFSGNCPSYVSDVIKMVSIIHKIEEDGAILAFLTSQMEVEWACENFSDPSVTVLPMHGKLPHEEQNRVMQKFPGKRKVIFSTNVAETSLTIQDVKFVVDSGKVKESRFEPSNGMNVLKVGSISQSSANQRAGRAGRTGPGKCYRLYSENDFQLMKMHQEPEIRKVHLGVAVLRILALGIKNIQDFDFVDSPNPTAIDMAVKNLVHLGAVRCKNDVFELTDTGHSLVKLGIEPRLGKIILDCFGCGLRKEGLVLAAVMANSSSIFCRVGSEEDKYKADCLRVPFCHRDGDLFTLLSVYKEWEDEHESRSKWCWQNSINAKSMRRCHDTVIELENCLRHELNSIVPSYWCWDPHQPTIYDKLLKWVILSCLVENVALYSGSDRLGYEVALTGQQLQLHPSCSLLVYGQKPSWVVFGEILSMTNQYLVCVSAVDYDDLYKIQPPLFDVVRLERKKMHANVITGVGSILLRRFCGKSNCNLQNILSYIRKDCMDDRIGIDVDFDRSEIQFFASAKDLERVAFIVNDTLEHERKWLRDECSEKCLFRTGPGTSSVALFGAGAEIKHLELKKRYLTVEISHPNARELNDKELLLMVDQCVSGIGNFSRHAWSGQDGMDSSKWGRITFVNPEFAEKAVANLNEVEFCGSLLKVLPVRSGNNKALPFSAVRAKVCWPRRRNKGVALITCRDEDAEDIVKDCFALVIGERYVNCEVSSKHRNCVFVTGIPRDVSEKEIYEEFVNATERKIFGVNLLKGEPINTAPSAICAEALSREIAPFMPTKHHTTQKFQVKVFDPEPMDHMVKAMITFDGSLHLEAAKALDHLQGKVLAGCLSWQKIECQHVFYSSICCSARIYYVIKKELDSLLESFKHQKGATCTLEKTDIGSYRVKMSANATKIVADLRKPLEELMKGKTISHPSLNPTVLQLLLSRDGLLILKEVERETGTYILYDRQNLNVKLFGPPSDVAAAEEKLVKSLLAHHENKLLEIRLRGQSLPSNLMKELVQRFGADLRVLKEKVPGCELTLNTRRHILCVRGTKEQKQKVEEMVSEVAALFGVEPVSEVAEATCLVCLCELEDPVKLEACGHEFCRACLVDQCESVIRSRDGFPLCCMRESCSQPFLLVDLRSLLPATKMEELFRASLGAFVDSSGGGYRFCPTPDCPAVYKVAVEEEEGAAAQPFVCGACSVETCTRCHLECHPFISCERYREYKDGPDHSVLEWRIGKAHVKDCPSCKQTIEKAEGCNHVECRCGKHLCWVCLECFKSSDECYVHLRAENHL